MEKILKPMSGYLALVICLLLFVAGLYFLINGVDQNATFVILGIICFVAFAFDSSNNWKVDMMSSGVISLKP